MTNVTSCHSTAETTFCVHALYGRDFPEVSRLCIILSVRIERDYKDLLSVFPKVSTCPAYGHHT